MNAMCCRAFPLPYSPEVLWENYEHYGLNEGKYPDANGHAEFMDAAIFVPMLRYIGFTWRRPPGVRDPANPSHLYACANLISEGLCAIHETKPDVCRVYLNCEFPDCESDDCRQQLEEAKRLSKIEDSKERKEDVEQPTGSIT